MPGAYQGLKAPEGEINTADAGTTLGTIAGDAAVAAMSASTPTTSVPSPNAVPTTANDDAAATPASNETTQPSAPLIPSASNPQSNPPLAASLLSAVTSDPQAAAEEQLLGAYFNLPVDLVQRNIGQLRKQYKIEETKRQLVDRPALTELMAKPGFAKQAIHEVEGLGQQEDAIKRYGRYHRVESDADDDISAAFKNVEKGAIFQITGLSKGIPVLWNSATIPNHVDIFQRIIAKDPTLVWSLQQTGDGPILAVRDNRQHGRVLQAPQYYRPGSDIYEFINTLTPAQQQAALATELQKLDPTASSFYQWGTDAEAWAKRALPTTAEQDNGLFTGKIPLWLGGTLPYAITTVATGGAATPVMLAGAGLTTTLAASNAASNAYDDAIAHHADQAKALKAAGADATIAAVVNSIPGLGVIESRIAQAIKPLEAVIGKRATGIAQRFLPTAVTGTAQSVAQGGGETAVARKLYDHDRSWTQGLAEQAYPAILAGVISRLWHGRASGVTSEPTTHLDRLLIELGGAHVEPPTETGAAVHPPETAPRDATDSTAPEHAKPALDTQSPTSTSPADATEPVSAANTSIDHTRASSAANQPAHPESTEPVQRLENARPPLTETRPASFSQYPEEDVAPRTNGPIATEIRSATDHASAANAEHSLSTDSNRSSDETAASRPRNEDAAISTRDLVTTGHDGNSSEAIRASTSSDDRLSPPIAEKGPVQNGSATSLRPDEEAGTSTQHPAAVEHEHSSRAVSDTSSAPDNRPSPAKTQTSLPTLQAIDNAGQYAFATQEILMQAAQVNIEASHSGIYDVAREYATRYHNSPDLIFSAQVIYNYLTHSDVDTRIVTKLPSIRAQLRKGPIQEGVVRIPLSEMMQAVHDKHDALLLPFLARQNPDSLSIAEMMKLHYDAEDAAKKNETEFPPDLIKTFAQTNVEGNNIIGTNKQARVNPDPLIKTSIEKEVLERNVIKRKLTPNSNLQNAHAEIEVLHQSSEADLAKGRQLKLNVLGRYICDYCKDDIAKAAEKAEFNAIRLTNIDQKGRLRVYLWRPTYKTMKEIPRRR